MVYLNVFDYLHCRMTLKSTGQTLILITCGCGSGKTQNNWEKQFFVGSEEERVTKFHRVLSNFISRWWLTPLHGTIVNSDPKPWIIAGLGWFKSGFGLICRGRQSNREKINFWTSFDLKLKLDINRMLSRAALLSAGKFQVSWFISSSCLCVWLRSYWWKRNMNFFPWRSKYAKPHIA